MRFSICRIVGNELPPRDAPGGKLATLRWILQRESLDVHRFWVLNHLHDTDWRRQVLDLLEEFGQEYDELVFDPARYRSLTGDRARRLYAININAARNHAIGAAGSRSRFVACLDQDCFFTQEQWSQVVCFIESDQVACPDRRYYGLGMKRVVGFDLENAQDLADEEPQIIFRNDAPRLFDADVPFGDGDKFELLSHLGYGPAPRFQLRGERCRQAGTVLHLSAGDPRQERDVQLRGRQRARSIEQLLGELDEQHLGGS